MGKVRSRPVCSRSGIPEARKWVFERVMEVVRRYDIDGVHFDDYFYYEGTQSRLNDNATYLKYNQNQFTNIGDFRRNNTYMLIKEVSEAIRQEKPWVKFGISPSGVWADKSEEHRTAPIHQRDIQIMIHPLRIQKVG